MNNRLLLHYQNYEFEKDTVEYTCNALAKGVQHVACKIVGSCYNMLSRDGQANANANNLLLESDQCQISPPAPPEILHHTVRRTWLFIAYSDER